MDIKLIVNLILAIVLIIWLLKIRRIKINSWYEDYEKYLEFHLTRKEKKKLTLYTKMIEKRME